MREDGSPRADLACFPKDFAKRVTTEYSQTIEETIAYGFSPFNLGKQSQQRLRDMAVYCVVKDLFLEDVTGLVFSGYGSEERYPVVVTCYMSAIIGGIAKRGAPSSMRSTAKSARASAFSRTAK